MRSPARDTSDGAHQHHIANIQAMTPAQRVAAAATMSRRALAQALWVVQQQRPERTPQEARHILFRRIHGEAVGALLPPTGGPLADVTFYDAIGPVIALLEDQHLAYYIGGAVASIAYGVPRSTMDVDIAVAIDQHDVPLFVQRLAPHYYFDAKAIREAISGHGSFNLIPHHGAVKIDIFVPAPTPFAASIIGRAVAMPITPDTLRRYCLPTAEDIILLKLQWAALKSDVVYNQRLDVIGVLQTQASQLDLDYIYHWAAVLGLADLFTQVRADAGIEWRC